MFTMLEAGAGLDVVLWLQQMEHPALNALAELFARLGGDTGYLLVLPLIYWCIDRRLGTWLLVVLTMGLFVIIGGKELLGRPRPYIFAPGQVQLLISPSGGFGFPSGHVGMSAAVWGFVALWARRWWGYGLLAAYLLVMGWARMYGGVHFPQDVAGGLLLGGAVAGGFYAGRGWLAQRWAALPPVLAVLGVVLAGVVMAAALRADEAGVSGAGILIGGGLGAMLAQRFGDFTTDGGTILRGARFVIGMVLTVMIFAGLDAAFDGRDPAVFWRVLRYGLVAVTILGVYPVAMVQTGLAPRAGQGHASST